MSGGSSREARRLRGLIADLDVIVWEADPADGRFTHVSGVAERMLGYHPRRWTTDPSFWASHVYPDDRDATVAAVTAASFEGRAHDVLYRFQHRDGSLRWLRSIGHVSKDVDGRAVVRGVTIDITPQKLAEERHIETEVRYRRLIEHLPAIVYTESVTEDELGVVFVSPQIRAILGLDPEDWIGGTDRWLARVHPEDRECVQAENERSDLTGEPFVTEYRMLAADGRVVWFHDESALVRDEGGRPLFWQGMMLDISEQRRAAELESALRLEREEAAELRALDEIKSTFLQAVSHDLRTPLAAILGLAVTLEREDVELHPDEARDLASRIAANARKLDKMVRDLLDLERIRRGVLEPTLSPADLGRLVRGIVAESELGRARRVEVDVESVEADVDVPKVERIVENLLANSLRHTPPEATVWVRVRAEGAGALILIDDDGPGVPPELRATIFEPFRQGPDTPEHSPGVGIGLALVARFAELHGGRAWVEERPGGGASFRVWLPKRPAPAG